MPWILFGCAALFVDGPEGTVPGLLLAGCWGAACFYFLLFCRSRRFGYAGFLILLVSLFLWWVQIPPQQDRVWMADVAHPPEAFVQGSRLTIQNVRNFHYRSETDFDENWETRTWDLDQLLGVNLILSYWGSPYICAYDYELGVRRWPSAGDFDRDAQGRGRSIFRGARILSAI
jgi:hypothetical protein